MDDLVFRLRERARIRRQIPVRKSVQEGKPDRIADLLEEAASALDRGIPVHVVTADGAILRDGMSATHGGQALAVYEHPREVSGDEYCWRAALLIDPSCRNCGATEKPDACSGGPWCAYPPHSQFTSETK